MLVRECLRKAPVTVPPECSLEIAAGLMGSHGVGALLVVSGGSLVGIVTDRDIAVRGVGTALPGHASVREVMSPDPISVQGSSDIYSAIRVLKEAGVRRLPVLEEDEVAGVVTVDDLTVWLVLQLGAVTTPVAGEIIGASTGR